MSDVFNDLLAAQVHNEFTAAQQYLAIAVYFDREDLPQLAKRFYQQALEERNHAMMFVRFLLDRHAPVAIPGVGAVSNDFASAREPIALALQQEKDVTAQIERLTKAARDSGDFLGEQFVHWFLQEQVEEVATMSTLLTIVDRADGNLFHVENFVARELGGAQTPDSSAPPVAGGAV